MWRIDKQFSFCYGHRVWSQKLVEEFCETGDYQCKCRHLHGHEGLVHVFLEGHCLERGMVTDFKHLGWLKNFIDTHLDHKFIIDINDPRFNSLVISTFDELCSELEEYPSVHLDSQNGFLTHHTESIYVPDTGYSVGWKINLDFAQSLKCSPVYEQLEGYTIVNFVPTSENFSQWMFDLVDAKMQRLDIKTSRVDWFETPKSRSSYSR